MITRFLGNFLNHGFAAKDSLKSGIYGFAIRAYDGHRRLYNEPWEGPSKPMKSGFAMALRRAISMG